MRFQVMSGKEDAHSTPRSPSALLGGILALLGGPGRQAVPRSLRNTSKKLVSRGSFLGAPHFGAKVSGCPRTLLHRLPAHPHAWGGASGSGFLPPPFAKVIFPRAWPTHT